MHPSIGSRFAVQFGQVLSCNGCHGAGHEDSNAQFVLKCKQKGFFTPFLIFNSNSHHFHPLWSPLLHFSSHHHSHHSPPKNPHFSSINPSSLSSIHLQASIVGSGIVEGASRKEPKVHLAPFLSFDYIGTLYN